jgi:hypothetical protein
VSRDPESHGPSSRTHAHREAETHGPASRGPASRKKRPRRAVARPARWLSAFRDGFQAVALRALGRLPGALAPATFVVGVPLAPPSGAAADVVVAPPGAPFAPALDDLEARIGEIERSAGASILTRAEAAAAAVAQALHAHRKGGDRLSFCAGAARIGSHHVIPVLTVDRDAYEALPALRGGSGGMGHGVTGFAEAVIAELLREAEEELHRPRPGRLLAALDADVILRAAGTALLFEAAAVGGGVSDAHALLDRLNVVSATNYERRVGRGRVVIAKADHPAVRHKLRFATPVPLGEAQWTRKLVEMASDGVALLSDAASVLGLVMVSEEYDASREDLFEIAFVDHYKWELRHGDAVLMRVEYATPCLPTPPLRRASFAEALLRVFPATADEVKKRLWRIVEAATTEPHGTMIVVSGRAAEEAERLASQCTRIEPLVLGDEMVRRVTSIDGAVLLDDEGRCHAVGVILDGRATPAGRPSRGSRYNSALRYVTGADAPTLAVVISEDGRVDLLPDG